MAALRRGSGQATIFKAPPQLGQCFTSISKTRLSSRAQLMRGVPVGQGRDRLVARWHALAERERFYCATWRWARARRGSQGIRCKRGRGTRGSQALHELQRLHDDMGGAVFVRTLQLQHDLAGAVTFEPFVGDGRSGDIAAELLQFFTLIGAPAHRRMEAKAVRIDPQLWGRRPGLARQALQAQMLRYS